MKHDYFKPGSHHVCMICETPIARLKDGVLQPLGNKAHVMLEREPTGIYTINCCKNCAINTNWKDSAILDEVHETVVKCNESLNLSPIVGKPVPGLVVSETDPTKRTDNVKLFTSYFKD